MDLAAPGLALGPLVLDSWTLLGRLPVAAALLALAFALAPTAGWRRAGLAASGVAAGLALGVAVLPSVLGAVAGGLLLCALTLRLLGARPPGAWPVAGTLLALVAVGRLGCLLNGCCFGVPTALPWGVTYRAGTLAADFHAHAGLVAAGARSAPVHPLQAYEALGVLLLLALVAWLRPRLRSGGAAALLAAAGYLALRASLDGWRAMLNTAWSLVRVGPLSAFQWAALAGSLACLGGAAALAWRARPAATRPAPEDHPPTPRPAPDPDPPLWTLLVAWATQAALVDLALPRLTPFLVIVAALSLAAAAALLAPALLADASGHPVRRRLAAALLALLLVPAGLRAAEGASTPGPGPTGRYWVYADARAGGGEPATGQEASPSDGEPADPTAEPPGAEPATAPPPDRLLRIGDQSTAPADLAARAEALQPLRRRTVSGFFGAGSFEHSDDSSCGGPTHYWTRDSFRAGLAYDQVTRNVGSDGEERTRDSWQLRGSYRSSTWKDSVVGSALPSPSPEARVVVARGSGGRWTAGGLYQWDRPGIGVGLGGLVGVDDTRDTLGPWFTTDTRVLYPGAYLRLGWRGFGLESGTLALHDPTEQPFLGLYFGRPETRVRLGLSSPYQKELSRGLAATGDLTVQREQMNWSLHLSAGGGVEATLRLGFDLP